MQLRAQLGVLRAQPPLVDRRPCSMRRELRELERLDQEVDGAALDRRDRLVDAAEAGDDDAADRRDSGRAPRRGRPCRWRRAAAGRRPGRRRRSRRRRLDRVGARSPTRTGAKPSASSDSTTICAKVGFVFDDEHGRADSRALGHTSRTGVSSVRLAAFKFRRPPTPIAVRGYVRRDAIRAMAMPRMRCARADAAFEVLVVDDDPEIRELLTELLRDARLPDGQRRRWPRRGRR